MGTYGPAYDEEIDGERIKKQHIRILNYMAYGHWKTLAEIAEALSFPEASVSAQLRHLRKSKFGSYRVNKRRRGSFIGSQWEYEVLPPLAPGQQELF